MQNTINFTVGDTKYVSNPFDFETMCIINDAHNDDTKSGPLSICREAVTYMFNKTEATEDIINNLPPQVHARLCLDVWKMYIEALSSKKE